MTEWDVVVAGGGPAGAVCAIELTRSGRRVLLLDAEPQPRYRIGESLSPTACAAFESYGIDLRTAGFVGKSGATFVWGDRPPFATYYADAAAWQVRRADLDRQVQETAAQAGATVRTGCRVDRVLLSCDRVRVSYLADGGSRCDVEASWVVDATGRDAVLARQRDLLDTDPALDYHAVWAYWHGGLRLPGRAAGNTLFVGGSPMWWYLPVDDKENVVGVGMVGPGGAPPADAEAAYRGALGRSPLVRELLGDARRSGPVRSAGASAQLSRRIGGPGWLLAGDAAGFVDPILAPGVQLAVHFGQLAARTVHAALTEPAQTTGLVQEYERRVRRQHDGYRRLAINMYAEAGSQSPNPPLDALAGGDEQPDRLTFMSVISGIPPHHLPPMLGGYLATRGAAVRYGGKPPAFGEVEGFAFLSWVLRHPEMQRPPLAPDSVLALAHGVVAGDIPVLPASGNDVPRSQRVVHNATGDRFLLTRELETMMRILAGEVSFADATKQFGAAFGADPDPEEFGRWIGLLGRHGLVAWKPA